MNTTKLNDKQREMVNMIFTAFPNGVRRTELRTFAKEKMGLEWPPTIIVKNDAFKGPRGVYRLPKALGGLNANEFNKKYKLEHPEKVAAAKKAPAKKAPTAPETPAPTKGKKAPAKKAAAEPKAPSMTANAVAKRAKRKAQADAALASLMSTEPAPAAE